MMRQNTPKVLMLGWEFPPILNGGLGIACYGLCNQLKNMTDLTMVIPKVDAQYALRNMNLIGLNSFDFVKYFSENAEAFFGGDYHRIHQVETNILPYQDISTTLRDINQSTSYTTHTTDEERRNINFDLYGGDMVNNVFNYAHLVNQIATKNEFDVVHAHDWMTFPAALKIKQTLGKPLVLHVHSLETDRCGTNSKGIPYQIEKDAMTRADAVVAVSNWTKRSIVRHYGIDPDKIHTIHNGIEQISLTEQKEKKPYKVVSFLGRITYQKGPEIFLEIAKRVLRAVPDVHFVMAGAGDRLISSIEKAADINISNRIHFTGFLNKEKVHELLSMTDVYVMPSVSEPFGLSALEAAQYQIPCVISKQSGVSEVLQHALKADFWDVNKTSEYIIALLSYEELKKAIVDNTEKDLYKVSWTDSAQKVKELYKKITYN
ncbi:glycosyltransferase family 4 protein [Fulvivirgaceae bacterium BMA10]|uniref:Glycosyltransferase family 4 protein n=1 Tax=Splendidivirga corallicola TaxID=3051826 RepID=A0ABT8KHM8_9BACT|nr:glycosyltransferase family 4 protein [Fulvivirgaceae bacterium BMA10]